MKKLMDYVTTVVSFIFSGICGAVLLFLWQPVARWYWEYRPVLGVDFYNTVSYLGFLSRHFALRFASWKYTTFAGFPLQNDYPTFHVFLNLPLLRWFSLPQAVQVYMLGSFFLFLFFSYLLFSEISRNKILGLVLAVALSVSIAPYGTLVWGGSLPYFATQCFLPLTLWLLFRYFSTGNNNWFYLSGTALGISFLGHPQVGFSFIVPICFLLLFLFPVRNERMLSFKRMKKIMIYFIFAFIVGYPQLSNYLGSSPAGIIQTVPMQIVSVIKPLGNMIFHKGREAGAGNPAPQDSSLKAVSGSSLADQYDRAQLNHFITETNRLFFIFAIGGILLFIFSFILRKKRQNSVKFFVYLSPLVWVFGYASLPAYGINVFQGGWYRAFWAFPLVLGIIICYCWNDFWQSILERIPFIKNSLPVRWFLILLFSGGIALGSFAILRDNWIPKMLADMENPRQRQQSSAFPDSLNVYVKRGENEELQKRLTPRWLDPNNMQYRLYDADQRVNIWWSSYFDMPLFKGYTDSPSGDTSGSFYWTDIALTKTAGVEDSLVKTWGTPEKIAYNNALFLIDWYALKYLEAEHAPSDSYNPPTSYLVSSDIFARKEKVNVPGWVELYNHKYGQPMTWHPDSEGYLTYYEIDDKYVSPISQAINAPVIGVIGAQNAYYNLLRGFASLDINSQKLIPLQLGQYIDNVSWETIKEMDAVILYAYNYKNYNRSWNLITKYVQNGGKVYIETGGDVKETDLITTNFGSKELPAFFPVSATKKEAAATEWNHLSGSSELKSIKLNDFGPPVLDGKPWPVSVPATAESLRKDAKVLLDVNGTPLIATLNFGKGEVIWSGMDLPYHSITYKNPEEAKLMKLLLAKMVTLSDKNDNVFTVERKSAEENIIKGNKARGVLFKEQNFPGWSARLVSGAGNFNLPVYKTGPSYPGFIYVIIPQAVRDTNFEVNFKYHGTFWPYFWNIISVMAVVLVCDKILLGGKIRGVINKTIKPVKNRAEKWWGKDNDY